MCLASSLAMRIHREIIPRPLLVSAMDRRLIVTLKAIIRLDLMTAILTTARIIITTTRSVFGQGASLMVEVALASGVDILNLVRVHILSHSLIRISASNITTISISASSRAVSMISAMGPARLRADTHPGHLPDVVSSARQLTLALRNTAVGIRDSEEHNMRHLMSLWVSV